MFGEQLAIVFQLLILFAGKELCLKITVAEGGKLTALLKTIQYFIAKGYENVIFETVCKLIVDALVGTTNFLNELDSL